MYILLNCCTGQLLQIAVSFINIYWYLVTLQLLFLYVPRPNNTFIDLLMKTTLFVLSNCLIYYHSDGDGDDNNNHIDNDNNKRKTNKMVWNIYMHSLRGWMVSCVRLFWSEDTGYVLKCSAAQRSVMLGWFLKSSGVL